MNLLNWFERKTAKWPNLMMILIGCYIVGFILSYVFPLGLYYVVFEPSLIFRGEVWRLFSFLLYAGAGDNLFMTLITCFIYFSISKTLEQILGRARVNFFLISGLVITLISGFLMFFILGTGMMLTPIYLYSSLFTLLALIYPDAQFLLFFFIPIKGKYMIFLTAALYLLDIIRCFASGGALTGFAIIIMVLAAVLNLILFITLNGGGSRKTVNIRAYQAQKKMRQAFEQPKMEYRHKCRICGRTEKTNPELQFRYCSKCLNGSEYCSDHIYTHMHLSKDGSEILDYTENNGDNAPKY